MRIGRFQWRDERRIGVFEDNNVRDVTDKVDSFANAIANPAVTSAVDAESIPQTEIKYLPPVTRSSGIFCAALNYEAHADESDHTVPEWPLIFQKLPRTLTGHEQPIAYHTAVTDELDYEGELVAVVGEHARHVNPGEALKYVSGYTILNDVTARDLQFGLSAGEDDVVDWFSGKAQQATTPTGPWVVIDEIDDPQDLEIASRVNGETLQSDSTGSMIESVRELVAFLSSRVRLEPGDLIATGTPEGVGTFQDIELDPGDVVEIEVEGIGTLRNKVGVATE